MGHKAFKGGAKLMGLINLWTSVWIRDDFSWFDAISKRGRILEDDWLLATTMKRTVTAWI